MNITKSLILLLSGLIPCASVWAEQPNIILVMADDQGWGDMAYNGHPLVNTPNFDEAARTGLNFNRFYAAAPVCSPTRASVLTGRHPNRGGVFKWGYPLRPQEVTIAEVLRKHGYNTAHFGKWHLGSVRHDSKSHPGKCGFDYWISAPNFFDNNPVLCHNGKAVKYEGESSIVTANLAIEWITEQSKSDQPFFAVVWFGSPHAPHRSVAEDRSLYAGLFADEENKKLRQNKINFLGEVTGMDRAYGNIRESLKALNIENNTVLWYTSDNGALPQVGSSGDFRGHKGQIYEGGLLVPSILHWPARIKAPSQSDMRCNTCDIFPTLLNFAGIEHTADRPIDGISLDISGDGRGSVRHRPMGFWDYTTNGRSVPADKLMYELRHAQSQDQELSASDADANSDRLPVDKFSTDQFPGHSAWMDGDWKLHRIEDKNGSRFELYNLKVDPNETEDLVETETDRVVKMKAELLNWLKSVVNSYNGQDY